MMQYSIPVEYSQLDESQSILQILDQAKTSIDNCIVGQESRTRVVLLTDKAPSMQDAYMAVYAAWHGASYPEQHDFLLLSEKNQFIFERFKQLVCCYAPQLDKGDNDSLAEMRMHSHAVITQAQVKEYFYNMMASNLRSHID